MPETFNTEPKLDDTFFLHLRQHLFADPERMAAHARMRDCLDSAKAWEEQERGDESSDILILECRVVRVVAQA
jgi:hypothetical protein